MYTNSVLLGNVVIMIARHPEVYRKVEAEIEALVEKPEQLQQNHL